MRKRASFNSGYFSDQLWICLRDGINENLGDQIKYELWFKLNDQLSDEIWKGVRYNLYQGIINYSRDLSE